MKTYKELTESVNTEDLDSRLSPILEYVYGTIKTSYIRGESYSYIPIGREWYVKKNIPPNVGHSRILDILYKNGYTIMPVPLYRRFLLAINCWSELPLYVDLTKVYVE